MSAVRFAHIKTHTFRNRLFRMFWRRPRGATKYRRWDGECNYHARTMHLNPDPDATELLGTAIHEGIHACFFDLEERAVVEAERDIMRLIRRMGIKVTFEP